MDKKLFKRGATLTLLLKYIDFQSKVATRKDASKTNITDTVKMCFNDALEAGDLLYEDWILLKNKIDNLKFETVKEAEMNESVLTALGTLEVVSNTMTLQEKPISSLVSLENLKSNAAILNLSSEVSEILALAKAKKEIEELLIKKMNSSVEMINENLKMVINKYHTYFSNDFIETVEK